MCSDGRLVFVTPEKFAYVESARYLREMLASFQVNAIDLIAEDTFCDHTTYPAVTTLTKNGAVKATAISLRDGTCRNVSLPSNGRTWMPILMGHDGVLDGMVELSDCCRRISAGIATGADGVFVQPVGTVPTALRRFAHPALAGRDISLSQESIPAANKMLLVPYDPAGALLAERKLGSLGAFLNKKENREKLEQRSCVQNKPWYAFHDSVPLPDMQMPKILCKDIGERPKFWVDRTGAILPLHSLYYMVPNDGVDIDALAAWLNGSEATTWLINHCQRAANGFIRLQSRVIKHLPVPSWLVNEELQRAA